VHTCRYFSAHLLEASGLATHRREDFEDWATIAKVHQECWQADTVCREAVQVGSLVLMDQYCLPDFQGHMRKSNSFRPRARLDHFQRTFRSAGRNPACSCKQIGPTHVVVPDGYFASAFADLGVLEPVASALSLGSDPRCEFWLKAVRRSRAWRSVCRICSKEQPAVYPASLPYRPRTRHSGDQGGNGWMIAAQPHLSACASFKAFGMLQRTLRWALEHSADYAVAAGGGHSHRPVRVRIISSALCSSAHR
jgi:hypothetical protein